jgi:hypothetical protein
MFILKRNENYAPDDAKANYYLVWKDLRQGSQCIGGIDYKHGGKYLADIHVPSGDSDVTQVYLGDSLTDAKTELFRHAEAAVLAGRIKKDRNVYTD